MMPTTRRGRFLFYKQRARKRLKVVYEHAKRKHSTAPGDHRPTNRRYDVSGLVKQLPRVYPLHFWEKSLDEIEYLLRGWTMGGRNRFGVIRHPPVFPTEGFPFDVRNGTQTGYHDRRVLSVPRLHSLPLLSYPTPRDLVPPGRFFPFAFYPSGRPSYASLQGWSVLP